MGCSMSGLTAARVLSDHFIRVTVLDRDRLPPMGQPRPGLPQAAHTHLLLASGCSALQRLFPGYRAEMMVRGAIEADVGDDGSWHAAGGRLLSKPTNLRSLLASRALLEGYARERLLRLHNVSVIDNCEVLAPIGSPERIRGVAIRVGGPHAREESMPADLVIDAAGRDSPMPRWLEALGLRAPAQEQIPAEMTYTTRTYPRTPDQLQGQLLAVIYPRANRRCGIALAVEDGRWMVTLGHAMSQPPPLEAAEFVEQARALATADLYDIVRAAKPLTQAVTTTFDGSLRRRYDRSPGFPEGLLVVGDALCSTNPIYAQGMSLGALQAQWLDRCLQGGLRRLGPRFFSAVCPLLDDAWSLVQFGDASLAASRGRSAALAADLLRGYLERLQRAAVLDASAAQACLRVLQLEAPPRSLLSASLTARALLRGDTQAAYTPHRRPVPG